MSIASIVKIAYPSGVEEEGDFVGGKLHGAGTRKHPDGSTERGTFVHGRLQRCESAQMDAEALEGTLYLTNGMVITGSFVLAEAPEAEAPEILVEETEEEAEEAEAPEIVVEETEAEAEEEAGPSRPQRKRTRVERYAPKGWTAGANNRHTAGRPIDPPDYSFDPQGRGDPVAQPRGVCNLPQLQGRRDGGAAPRCSGYKRDGFVVSSSESSEEESSESSEEESSEEEEEEESSEEEETPRKRLRRRR